MVVSVTEPKLLIKILHVTFTGGPVGWNENDMTRGKKSLKSYVPARMTRFDVSGDASQGNLAAASPCIQACFNTTSSACFFCLLFGSKL